ncbi:SDR family oxidoreductase [Chondromyces apiculatus]|uniref:3-oxoacyl-[acyl-carrier protein] reductase n=1 Tax=Chondromyces apiculatus DSM 436 TaxID=1192034 RepID=A0A017SSZ3_9BACT|nr:SDR family oxidoreductase [Chondromyces apiculatus]EYF00054.1 3-oxoacyl-[acyl-carrier protein] reductase [Chondromyces apiculatus DSM 436]
MTTKPLEGKIALVAGATRGAGRGIATMLGEAGATVYCTGRSVRGKPATGTRPETIDETAEMVTARGGHGIPVQVDHSVEPQVEALIARIRKDHGKLDLLVNDIWGGDALTEFKKPFWQLSVETGRTMLDRAIFTHIITAKHAVPLLREREKSLIVEITDGDTYAYRGHLYYDLVKTTVIRLAFLYARELRHTGVSAVAVTPGFLRSEEMLENFGVTEANWKEGAATHPDFVASETPFFVGRAVAALAADPNVRAKNGRVYASWTLSDEYGFTDIDGSRPHWGNFFQTKYGDRVKPRKAWRDLDDGFYDYWNSDWIELSAPDWMDGW